MQQLDCSRAHDLYSVNEHNQVIPVVLVNTHNQVIPVILYESSDELIHTAEHEHCEDMTCPCNAKTIESTATTKSRRQR